MDWIYTIVFSFLVGYGIFAKTQFPQNDFIVEYASEYITKGEALKREEFYDKKGEGSYLFFLGSHGYVRNYLELMEK